MPLSKFYSFRSSCFTLGFLTLFLFVGSYQLAAQNLPSMSCHSKLNASLDVMCEVIFDGTHMAAGEGAMATPDQFELTVTHKGTETIGSVFSSADNITYEVSNKGTYIKFTQPGSFVISVKRLSDGVTCWGHLDIEDKLAPFAMDCPCSSANPTIPDSCIFKCASIEAFKNDSTLTGQLGLNPTFLDNCDTNAIQVQFRDELTQDTICGNWFLTRTWQSIVPNAHGLTKLVDLNCTQKFFFEAIGMDSIYPPKRRVIVPCGVNTDPDSLLVYFSNTLPNLDSAVMCAFPYIVDTIAGVDTLFSPLRPSSSTSAASKYCKLITSYSDTEASEVCGNSIKFVRTWTVIDWCNTSSIDRLPQIIKVEDNEHPYFTIGDTITVNSDDPWICGSGLVVPFPDSLADNCDAIDAIDIKGVVHGPAGFIVADINNGYTLSNLAPGTYDLIYTVFDQCDNDTVTTIKLIIKDIAEPVVVTKDEIVVSFTNFDDQCIAKVFPENVNAGSYDACDGTNLKYEVKRKTEPDSSFGEFVKFTKADLQGVSTDGVPFGVINVVLKTTDQCGNFSVGWTKVRLEDKSSKVSIDCGDLTIPLDCTNDNLNSAIEAYAPVVSISACETSQLETESTIIDSRFEAGCSVGKVTVAYFIKGAADTICIKVFDFGAANPPSVQFPAATITVNCTDEDFGDVVITNDECNLIRETVTEDEFKLPPTTGFCKKIIRKFTVIDWCTYNPEGGNDTTGIYKFTQIIYVDDNTRPIVTCESASFELNGSCAIADFQLEASATDAAGCDGDELTWEAGIDTDGNGSFDLTLDVLTGFDDRVVVSVEDSFGPGTYQIRWTASDDCGNSDTKICSFDIIDNSIPTPNCITSISTTVMNTSGTAVIWANDFDPEGKSGKPCGGEIFYSFSSTSPFEPSKSFTCDDISDGQSDIFELRVYVWDAFNNRDFCTVQLRVDDNAGVCDDVQTGNAAISGMLYTESGDRIESASVSLSNMTTGDLNQFSTEVNGEYAFADNPMYVDYDITAQKVDDPINGVSTLDLILIQRHILNLKAFDSPYKVIAADANTDERVTALDLVVLRRLILGLIDELPGGETWKFINSAQAFENTLDPWPISEAIYLEGVLQNAESQNFIGVKIGDVNGNAIANSAKLAKSRSVTPMVLTTEDQYLDRGQRHKITLSAEDWNDVHGMQLVVNTRNAQVIGVSSDALDLNSDNYTMTKSHAMISWNSIAPVSSREILTIEIIAEEEGHLSEFISISNSIASSEVYSGQDLTINPLRFVFAESSVDEATVFELYQNEPNPFNDATKIGFNIPQDGNVDLTVFDLSGKQVYRMSEYFNKGKQAITVKADVLESSGVWYYQLSYKGNVATRKMIVID